MSENKKLTPHVMQHARVFLILTAGLLLVATGPAKADFVFRPPENLGLEINTPLYEAFPEISDNGLALWFTRQANWDEAQEWWLATRPTQDAPWEAPVNHGEWTKAHWNFIGVERGLTTPDGLELYFSREVSPREGGRGGSDLWMLKRDSITEDWGPRTSLGPIVNSMYDEWNPFLSANGLELYFCDDSESPRPGGSGSVDLWVTTRAFVGAPWTEPQNLGPAVNSSVWDTTPSLSQDGLVLFFDSYRSGGYGSYDLYMTRRNSLAEPWGPAVNLGPVINSPLYYRDPRVSHDGSTLFWWGAGSRRFGGYGGYDVWQASLVPIADFSGDGMVDDTDLSIMEDHWDKNHPQCDIGPMPWGDGVVNEMDREVLMAHWGQTPEDPRLVSHWELDETEGDLASDSQAEYHGTVHGSAVWQPSEGQFGGALQFDGSDDYIGTDLKHDPSERPFRVFAWIKGGAPGQAIISQEIAPPDHHSVWLGLDPSDGRLVSSHMYPTLPLLESDIIVTDDQWHHVGLLWDGTYRQLCVDGNEVASDSVAFVPNASTGSLRIGAGSHLESNSFWTGLIDDVRFMDPSGPHPPGIKQELGGFQIYADNIGLDAFYTSYAAQGAVDHFWDDNPAEGDYCIYWTGVARYNDIEINFWPDKDLAHLVNEGYALEFWCRGRGSGRDFDVRFIDTKTDDPDDHPWFIRKKITTSLAPRDGQWHHVRIPLQDFREHGSNDSGVWYNPQGDFDWGAVDRFGIQAQYGDLKGVQLWFDDIRIAP